MRSSIGAMAAGFFSEPFQNTRIVETPFTEQSAAQSVCPGFANSPYLQRRPNRPNSLPRNWAGTRYATGSRSNAARPRIKALDIFADNNRCWLAVRIDAGV